MGDVVQALRPTTKQATPAADPLLLKHREMVLRYIEGAIRGLCVATPGDAITDVGEAAQENAVRFLQRASESVGRYFDELQAKEA